MDKSKMEKGGDVWIKVRGMVGRRRRRRSERWRKEKTNEASTRPAKTNEDSEDSKRPTKIERLQGAPPNLGHF